MDFSRDGEAVLDNLFLVRRATLDANVAGLFDEPYCYGDSLGYSNESPFVPEFSVGAGGQPLDPTTSLPLPSSDFPWFESFDHPSGDSGQLRAALEAEGWAFAGVDPTFEMDQAYFPTGSATEEVLRDEASTIQNEGLTTGRLFLEGGRARVTLVGLEPFEVYTLVSWFSEPERIGNLNLGAYTGPLGILPVGPSVLADSSSTGDERDPSISGREGGEVVIAWQEGFDLLARRLDVSDQPVGATISVDQGGFDYYVSGPEVDLHPELDVMAVASSWSGFSSGMRLATFDLTLDLLREDIYLGSVGSTFAGLDYEWDGNVDDEGELLLGVADLIGGDLVGHEFQAEDLSMFTSTPLAAAPGVTAVRSASWASGIAPRVRLRHDWGGSASETKILAPDVRDGEIGVAVDAIGQVLVAWVEDDAVEGPVVRASLSLGPATEYTSASEGAGPVIELSASQAGRSDVVVATDGDSFLVAWIEDGEVVGRLVDGGGHVPAGVVILSDGTSEAQNVSVTGYLVDGLGQFAVVWDEPEPTRGGGEPVLRDIRLRRFSTTPNPVTEVDLRVGMAGLGSGSVTGPGIDCPPDCEESFPVGSWIGLNGQPLAGSRFVGWSHDCDHLVEDCVVSAVFQPFWASWGADPASMAAVGDADLDGQLTTGGTNQTGAWWIQDQISIGLGFGMDFSYRMAGDASNDEGMALVLQDEGLGAIGGAGPGLGYGTSDQSGIARSLAVELDISQSAGESDGDHLAIHANGVSPNCPTLVCQVATDAGGITTLDEEYPFTGHQGLVRYRPGRLEASVEAYDDFSFEAYTVHSVTAPVDLRDMSGDSILGGPDGLSAWVGFTASTTDSMMIAEVSSWTLWLDPAPAIGACVNSFETEGGVSIESVLGSDSWARVWDFSVSSNHSWWIPDNSGVQDHRLALEVPALLGETSRLMFWSRYSLDELYDGGVLEYSTDNGASWNDILAGNGVSIPANLSRIQLGGYTAELLDGALAGREAWTGASVGWQLSVVDLADFAGTMPLFRWRFGTDSIIGGEGWWIDDVSIENAIACEPPLFWDGFESGDVGSWS